MSKFLTFTLAAICVNPSIVLAWDLHVSSDSKASLIDPNLDPWGQRTFTDSETMPVQISRHEWVFLEKGDAYVTCEDNKKSDLVPNKLMTREMLCGREVINVRKGSSETIGIVGESIPYILSPRYTNLLETNPTLSWNHVGDDFQYEVCIHEEDGPHWQEPYLTEDSSIPYPESDKRPHLDWGLKYVLIVKAIHKGDLEETRDSLQEILWDPIDARSTRKQPGFFMLSLSAVESIRKYENNARNSKFLPEEQASNWLFNFYKKQELNTDVISILEQVGSDRLGGSLERVKLTERALEQYEKNGAKEAFNRLSETLPELQQNETKEPSVGNVCDYIAGLIISIPDR